MNRLREKYGVKWKKNLKNKQKKNKKLYLICRIWSKNHRRSSQMPMIPKIKWKPKDRAQRPKAVQWRKVTSQLIPHGIMGCSRHGRVERWARRNPLSRGRRRARLKREVNQVQNRLRELKTQFVNKKTLQFNLPKINLKIHPKNRLQKIKGKIKLVSHSQKLNQL